MPEGPVLMQVGGSGGSDGGDGIELDQGYWLWPLPPAGRLAVFAEWPAFGIELSTAELGADALRAAAGRSQALWCAPEL